MKNLLSIVKGFVGAHKAVAIGTASVLGVAAVGGGAYAIYNAHAKEPEVKEEVKDTEIKAAADVYIPAFQSVYLTSDSLEKDLTIYISSDGENCITGVPFQVKLLTPEAAEGLQSYVDAINDLDQQIAEYTAPYIEAGLLPAEPAAEEPSEEEKEEPAADAEKPEAAESEEAETPEAEEEPAPTEAEMIKKILEERNVAVTVTDENGEVVETQPADIESDPLYLLYLDKETAVQAFTVALNEAEGTVYTDEDMDGVISQKDMTPGDYVACLVNSIDGEENTITYEPTTYKSEVNVKDKVELKVQKEIIKQVKQDAPAEDGQKKEAAIPVEAAPKDTVEFVESKKIENGSAVKETTDAVAPKGNAKNSKATKKDGGKTRIDHQLKPKAPEQVTITVKYVDEATNVAISAQEDKKFDKGTTASITAPDTIKDYTRITASPMSVTCDGNKTVEFKYRKNPAQPKTVPVKYIGAGDKTPAEGSAKVGDTVTPPAIDGYTVSPASYTVKETDTSVTFTYTKKEEPTPEAPKTYDVTVKYSGAEGLPADQTVTGKKAGDTITPPAKDGYTVSPASYTVKDGDNSVTFTYTKKEEPKPEQTEPEGDSTTPTEGEPATNTGLRNTHSPIAASFLPFETTYMFAAKTASAANIEVATLDMSYSKGTFTITSTANVSNVTVNGTAIKMEKNKGTFKATQDGDYTLAGLATFSDGETDGSLTVTYTVTGFGGGTSEKLKDSKGNQLYLDPECTKEATAADYVKGKTYYYREAAYIYYGWQTIDGRTFFFDKNANPVTGTQTIQGVVYNFGTDGALVANGTGIDVSKHQGAIDWKLAGPAVSFAIIRCGYRGINDGLLHEDPYFYTNMKGARGNGVNTGIYIYSTALNEAEAVAEASMAVAMANKAGGCSLPIYIDMEDTQRGQSSLSNEQRTAIINAFITTVQSGGHRAGVYASKSWMSGKINAGSLPGSCSIWVAQYNTACSYSGRYNIWQYSSKGSIPGIKGNVDMDKSYF